jgi:hypothetical protein
VERFYENTNLKLELASMEALVAEGSISPFQAAARLLGEGI